MTTTLLMIPDDAADCDPTVVECQLPAWLYRSEAFAEDLLVGDSGPSRPVRPALRERLPASLYLATLALATLALPATLLPA